MKTAVLISGQLRTFGRCLPLQHWLVYRHFQNVEFFIYVQDTPDVQAVDDLRRLYGADRVHIHARPDPDLSEWLVEPLPSRWGQAPYANAAPAHQLLLQHWYSKQVWDFFNAQRGETEFATIIRMRGDNFFKSFVQPKTDGIMFNTVHAPWWGRFSGLNDRFAVMGSEAAGAYFTLWDAIPSLLAEGCPFHPETLLKAQLERENVCIREDLMAEFSTLRSNGEERWPEITPIDIAHASLRIAA